MKPIISVEGLGKKYVLRHEGKTPYKSLREEIFHLPKKWLSHHGEEREEFWALKDVSFDIMPGDRVGIIGRNGAGKSTLLKLLSRITEPSAGRITMRGRVASLLEVGTGFHPELTGRENIYLNGAILGMSRAEVKRKFDEIVDFAGVEKFLDTPVKRYSSGMYVRLAFAVAAHLEPEILVVDEVLAVGDAEFQKKCLGKMEEVSKGEGRTVLFVSHNMAAVQQLCSRGILLAGGVILLDDSSDITIKKYIKEYTGIYKSSFLYKKACAIKLLSVSIVDFNNNDTKYICINDNLNVIFEFEVFEGGLEINFGIAINSVDGNRILTAHIEDGVSNFCNKFEIGVHRVLCTVKNIILTPGNYFLFYGIRDIFNESLVVSSGSGELFTVFSEKRYNNISGVVFVNSIWSRL